MNATIIKNYEIWLKHALSDPDLIQELKDIRQIEAEIQDRFYKDLEFGTGGLRGVIGAGTNRMNVYTVGRATQGYANYLNARGVNPSVAIAYDSRIKSESFARHVAAIFAANGIKVWIYKELMPTPSLSFAIRYLRCQGGVVVTASHNPSKYNGYKVYGPDGGQITSMAAKEILGEMSQVDFFEDVRILPFNEAMNLGMIRFIDDETITAYIQAVSVHSFCNRGIDKNVSIVYTPLNGAGLHCVTRALRENGFTNITVVKEQENPDGNFPTCPYPNPEREEALALGIEYAGRLGSDLLLATDPDCDRVGTAVKSKNGYTLLNGDEMGLLLFDYICKRRIALGTMPENPILVKTIVTTDLAKKVAAGYGVQVIDVLTGFKYIGEQIGWLEENGEEERYIFGFEESYGYLSGGFVRDKDGVNASLLICEMFAYYKSMGKNLLEVLDELYKTYGYCHNTQRSFTFEGAQGFEFMQSVMSRLRHIHPNKIGGKTVESVSDYKSSITSYISGDAEEIHLPQSNVLKFMLEGNSSVVVRPSGTEPKLKIYICISAAAPEAAQELETVITEEIKSQWLKQ